MDAKEFVGLWRKEKDALVSTYMDPVAGPSTVAGKTIHDMGLSTEQLAQLREAVDGILTEAFYGLLLALDGEASLGGEQRTYRIHDEDGSAIAGDIEEEAYAAFHED